MTLTEEQLEQRRKGLTATDMAAVLGLDEFRSPIDVVLEKQEARRYVQTERMEWGEILQGPVQRNYASRHGVFVKPEEEIGTLTHPIEQWLMATPDGLVYERPYQLLLKVLPIRGHEVKTHTIWAGAFEYGNPGSDEVPASELIQCAVCMAVCDLDRWDLTAFVDGLPYDYTILRDKELEESIIEIGREFWKSHIRDGLPVPPDGSASYSRELARRLRDHSNTIVRASNESCAKIKELYELRARRREQKTREELLVQQLKLAIGDNAGLSFPGLVSRDTDERITWKRTKDVNRTDWEVAFRGVRDLVLAQCEPTGAEREALLSKLDSIVTEVTTTRPGARRFVVPRSWNK